MKPSKEEDIWNAVEALFPLSAVIPSFTGKCSHGNSSLAELVQE
jgi:hypothetical protein